jgi:uncharacterized protein YkwD
MEESPSGESVRVGRVTLTRGGFTNPRHVAYPGQGRDESRDRSYGAHVPSPTAAAPTRLGWIQLSLTALLLAALAALFVANPADGGPRAWSAYLAPTAACKGATDASASPVVQRRAVACLINWARRQNRRARLSQSASLQQASGLKGQKVASCGDFSHTPCGSDLIGPLKASGYRYASFGENLYVGPWGSVTPRDVVAAWLQSPGHRENMLKPYFRDVGAASVRASGLVSGGPEVVWIASFGSKR